MRQERSTPPSAGSAPNDSSRTAVGTGGKKEKVWKSVVTSAQYWNSRMSVLISASTGLVV